MLYLALAMALTTTVPLAAAAATPAVPAAAGAAPAVPPPLPPDPAATEFANRFAAVLKCEPTKKDPGRHLCALARIGKDPIWTPGQLSSYVGVSLKVKSANEPVTDAKANPKANPKIDPKTELKKIAAEPLTVVALHLAAGSARIAPLGAASEAEKPKLQALLTDLQNQLKGDKKDALVVPPELVSRLRNERKGPRSPLKLSPLFAEFTGPAPTRLYRVDLAPVLGITTGQSPQSPVFVSVETVPDGQQISIFPATPIEN